MTSKAKSKIAKSEARACAGDLISTLHSVSDASEQVKRLISQYTVGARTVIIAQAVDLLGGKRQNKFEVNVMELLIRGFITTQKPQGLDKLILSLADLCAVALVNGNKGWALGVVAAALGDSKVGLVCEQTFESIGAKLRNDDHLAESLEYIVESGAHVWAIQLWECMALPAVGDLSKSFSISQQSTTRIIGLLSRLDPRDFSKSLPLLIPVLLNHAEPGSRDKFLKTSAGKAFRKNLLGADRQADQNVTESPRSQLGEDDRQLLQLIRQRFVDKNQELESLLENAESKYAEHQADFQHRLREAQSENYRLSELLQKSQDIVRQLESDMEGLRAEVGAKDEELAKHVAEIRHLNREKKNQQTDQIERHHENLQKKLIEPAATVRDLVIEICSPKGRSQIEPRSLAVAFDTLHRRILTLAKAEDNRIPRNILAGKMSNDR